MFRFTENQSNIHGSAQCDAAPIFLFCLTESGIETAKKAFDPLNATLVSKIARFFREYGGFLDEKQQKYAKYRALRQKMIDHRTIRHHVDKVLSPEQPEQEQRRQSK